MQPISLISLWIICRRAGLKAKKRHMLQPAQRQSNNIVLVLALLPIRRKIPVL